MSNRLDAKQYAQDLLNKPSTSDYLGSVWDQAATETPWKNIEYLKDRGYSTESILPEDFYKSEDYRPGQEYRRGMTKGQQRLLAEDYDETVKRAEIMRKYPDFYGRGLVEFGVGAAAHMADPINLGVGVALGLVPGIGWASLGARLGLAGSTALGTIGRAAVAGAVEGVVGSILVEPIIFAGQEKMQRDYTLFNSLQNVMFGAVGGGIIGGGVGGIGYALGGFGNRLAASNKIQPNDTPLYNGYKPKDVAQNVSNAILAIETNQINNFTPVQGGKPQLIQLSDKNLVDELFTTEFNQLQNINQPTGQMTYASEYDLWLNKYERLGYTNELNAGKIKLNELVSDENKLIYPTPEIESLIRQFVDDKVQAKVKTGSEINDLGLPEDTFKTVDSIIFRGPPGTGKSSIGDILVAKYGDNTKFLPPEDITPENIEKLLSGGSVPKYLIIDEFDKLSKKQMDSLNQVLGFYKGKTKFVFTTNADLKKLGPEYSQIINSSEDVVMDGYTKEQKAAYAVSLAKESGMMGKPIDELLKIAEMKDELGNPISLRGIKTNLESLLEQKGKKNIVKYDQGASLFGFDDAPVKKPIEESIAELPLKEDQSKTLIEFMENAGDKSILILQGPNKDLKNKVQKAIQDGTFDYDKVKIGGQEVISTFDRNTLASIQTALKNPYQGEGYGWLIQIEGTSTNIAQLAKYNNQLEKIVNASPTRARIVINVDNVKMDKQILASIYDRAKTITLDKKQTGKGYVPNTTRRGVPNSKLRTRSAVASEVLNDDALKTTLINAQANPELQPVAQSIIEQMKQFSDDPLLDVQPELSPNVAITKEMVENLNQKINGVFDGTLDPEKVSIDAALLQQKLMADIGTALNNLIDELQPQTNGDLLAVYDKVASQFPDMSTKITQSSAYQDVLARANLEGKQTKPTLDELITVKPIDDVPNVLAQKAEDSRIRLNMIRQKLINDKQLLKNFDDAVELAPIEAQLKDVDETINLMNDPDFIRAAANAIKCLRT